MHIINLRKTWEKILLAARAIAAIENPADVFVISSRQFGQRAVLKFSAATGCTPIAGRFTPGTFTNQSRKETFREPRLLLVCDPRADHQPITEASYVNIPVVAFCNTDSPLRYVDVAIPCNNKGIHSIGLMWWLLAREVLRLQGKLSRRENWDVMVDMYFFREAEEQEKEVDSGLTPDRLKIGTEAIDYSEAPEGAGVAGVVSQVDYSANPLDWNSAQADDWNAPVPSQPMEEWANPVTTDWTS